MCVATSVVLFSTSDTIMTIFRAEADFFYCLSSTEQSPTTTSHHLLGLVGLPWLGSCSTVLEIFLKFQI